MLTQPMRGVPLASAHDLATWLGMRVPTDAEAYALADVHTPKNLMWTASGAGVAWERDHAVSMSQAVEQARPIVFLVR